MTIATPISATFSRLQAAGHMAFMPFITAGDPDMATTVAVIEELAARGVDMIEIGFPYSDPIADGPVIQASYTRALAKKIKVQDIFRAVRELSARNTALPPLVAMVSFAIIHRRGTTAFFQECQQAGFSGAIVPDLPAEESATVVEAARACGLDLIQLIAPTTTPARTKTIVAQATGFLYCISVAGITGERKDLPEELQQQLRELGELTTVPRAVGFGISRPEQVAGLRGLAQGVIVGSAIVRQMAMIGNGERKAADVIRELGDFAASFVAEVHQQA